MYPRKPIIATARHKPLHLHGRTIFATVLVVVAISLVANSRPNPIAIVALVMAGLLLIRALWLQYRMFMLHRRVWRMARGKCPTCGYDVRASADRCPECGGQVYTYPSIGR